MIQQNFQVIGIDTSVFRRAVEEIFGMLNNVLVERRARRDQHRKRRGLSAPRAARTLPRGRDGAGIAGHHDCVKRTDVHAEFQRIGSHHSANLTVPQFRFNLPALLRQIPAPITAHAFPGAARMIVFQISQQHFRRQPAVGEH